MFRKSCQEWFFQVTSEAAIRRGFPPAFYSEYQRFTALNMRHSPLPLQTLKFLQVYSKTKCCSENASVQPFGSQRLASIGDTSERAKRRRPQWTANGIKPRLPQVAMDKLQLAIPQLRVTDATFRTWLLEQKSPASERRHRTVWRSRQHPSRNQNHGKVCGFQVSYGQVFLPHQRTRMPNRPQSRA